MLKNPGDYLLIQFGHNDDKKDPAYQTNPKTTYRDYLRRFISEGRNKGFTPVLVTPPHRRKFKGSTPSTELKVWADAMKAVAAEQGVLLVDLYTMTGDELRRRGMSGSASLYVSGDNTHFSPAGAELYAKFVAGRLKKLDAALAPVITAPAN